MIRGIVFDFDGVIANSEPTHLAALTEVLDTLGISLTPEDYYARYLGLDDAGVFRTVGKEGGLRFGPADIARLIEQKSAIFDEMIAREDVLFPGARTCIERLAARYPLGIASGALRHEIEAVLERGRIAGHFRFIVSSGETARSKPFPDPYERAAALHDLPPSALLAIEDSRWGIESAKTAGLKCVAITTSYPAADLPGADRIIRSLDEFTPDLVAQF